MERLTSIKKTVDIRREVRLCPTCKYRFSREAAFCPFDGVKLESAPFDPLADPLIGTRVEGRYDVVSVLGEGGMGRIYQVRHAALDRPFAMKVLRPELAREADLAARFILEAKATASVKHPNVVQITDFGRMPDDVPYFVMELLVGHTLGEVIKAGGPVPAPRAVRILRKVAAALAAAHAAGVVHRDLKPDNVFLVGGARDVTAPDDPERGRSLAVLSYGADVRVVDFGAARIVGTSRVTRQGVVFGTPHYMSPEQASGQEIDQRADIYSLGVIMYEMFTGRVPFQADTYMGVLTQHMFVKPVPPSEAAESAKELGALEAITLRCLEKKPDDRYGSMDEVVRAIDELVQLRGDDGMPPTPSSAWRAADVANVEVASARPSSSRAHPRYSGYGSTPGEAYESELPSFDEMRTALDGNGIPRDKAAWVAPVALVAVGGLLAGLLGAAHWLRPREGSSVAPSAAPLPEGVREAGTAASSAGFDPRPAWTAVAPAAVVVPTVGERGSTGDSLSPPVASPRPRPPAAAVTAPRPAAPTGREREIDDVGDPFAAKH